MIPTTIHWVGFNVFVLLMLILDLGVFHRKSHEVKFKEALIWTGVWIGLSLLFNLGIYYFMGKEKALEFLAGYLIEKSLSVDNIFVFLLIFTYFRVPGEYQHKVLFWGIMGALVMRVIFIFSGIALINKFHWIIFVFAAFLIFTGIRMFFQDDDKLEPEKTLVVRLFKRFFRMTDKFHGNRFIVKIDSKTYATPLLLVVLVVETSDLIFAVDSIPAILAVSTDQFIVYTSNAFAILGLRSLYFALADLHKYFRFLKYGLSAILIFVGIKMIAGEFYPIPIAIALIVIAAILAVSIIASVVIKPEKSNDLET